MYSHVTVGTTDLTRAKAFYEAIMSPLGIPFAWEHEGAAFSFGRPEDSQFVVCMPFDGNPHQRGNGWHAAFLADSRATVDAFYAAAIAAGGEDEGPPGLRAHYHPNYYAAYVRDLDGNKLQAVCHQAP